jgi:hypothetical protein
MGRRVKINRPPGMKVEIRPPDEVVPPFAEGGIVPPENPTTFADYIELLTAERTSIVEQARASLSSRMASGFDRNLEEDFARIQQRSSIETNDQWREWSERIPFIQFPPEWEVRIVPPYGGAVARFYVRYGNNQCSVYLDCYDRLGYFGAPYWEVYPIDNDVARAPMEDVPGLLELIRQSLEEDHE